MYKKVILKISGELFKGEKEFGLSEDAIEYIVEEINKIPHSTQLAIVVGGGNIFRGRRSEKMFLSPIVGDYVGMVATLINALVLGEKLKIKGKKVEILSSLEIKGIIKNYSREEGIKVLEEGKILILAGGTGRPAVTTDSATALWGIELGVEVFLKGTKVDGIYSGDPGKDGKVKFYPRIEYQKVMQKELKVMDITAVSLCKENGLPIKVFNFKKPGNLREIILGNSIGSEVVL
jgi:uridylate kinase